jgi:hypothetical protein
MDIETTLRQAIVAAKEGRKEEARYLLETVLDADERNEQVWLWMSAVVDSDEERIVCLENVLTINPNNEAARKGLAALGMEPEIEGTSSPLISEEASADSPVASPMAPAIESIDGDVPSQHSTAPDRRPFIAITAVLVLMLICTVVSILAFVILSPT